MRKKRSLQQEGRYAILDTIHKGDPTEKMTQDSEARSIHDRFQQKHMMVA